MLQSVMDEVKLKGLRWRARRQFAGRAAGVAAAALWLAALVLVVDTLITVARLHSALPYWDEWDNLTLLKDLLSTHVPLTDLFRQHNEHRIFFPRLVIFSDYLFFGGRGILNVICIVLVQFAHAGLLIWLIVRTRVQAAGAVALSAVVLMLLFSLRQEENFSWGFQVQFVSVFALATLAIILFSGALVPLRDDRPYRAQVLASFAVVSIATFTMANGLIAAAILVLFAVFERVRGGLVPFSIAVLTGLAALYVQHYRPVDGHTPLSLAVRQPLDLLNYTAVYLGGFLNPDLQAARLLGLWGLAAMVGAGWRLAVSPDRDANRLALIGVMLFAAGSAFITALGRSNFGVEQAFASRYAMGSGTFWSAVLIFWWASPATWRGSSIQRAAVGMTAAVLVFGAVRSQFSAKLDMEERAFQQRLATAGLLLGLHDENSFDAIEDPTGPLSDMAAFLKARHISIFGERDADLVGRPIGDAGPLVPPEQCSGGVTDAATAPDLGRSDAARISGRALGAGGHHASDRIYLTGVDDRIIGLATRHSRFNDASSWEGFLVSPGGSDVHAYVRLSDGGLCEIGRSTISP